MIQWMNAGIMFLVCWNLQWGKESILSFSQNQAAPFSSCDLIVDAGPDTSVCAPGGSIGLTGSITGNSIFHQWSPASGLNNPFILNPVANVNGPITYTLTAYALDPTSPNLIVNGDFEMGNIGFLSDYTYVADIVGLQDEMFPEGTYTVIDNPNLVHSGFNACNDHTVTGVNMMVINGAASLQDIWCQTIMIEPNTFYNVSAWVASVNSSSPAILRFSINSIPLGNIVNAPSTSCLWVPFNATWNSGSTTSAEICILNLNTALGGNDFALDDISMVSLCSVTDEVEITLDYELAPEPVINGPDFLCEGETGVYTATLPLLPPILSYEWSVPFGATILSGQGTPQITVQWNTAQSASLCLMVETRCDANQSCFDVTVGSLPILPLISGPTSLCPGGSGIFYTYEHDPGDSYYWTVSFNAILLNGQGTNEIEVEWALQGEVEICVEVTNICGSRDNCTYLTLLPDFLTLIDTSICAGTTIEINGNTYGNGLFSGTEYFQTQSGCDSIVEIFITEVTRLETMVMAFICPGDSIFLEGAYQSQSGIYIDSFVTVSNCDSLIITEVVVSPFDTTWISTFTCDPAEAGTSIMTFSDGNCDSTVITQHILIPMDTTIISLFSCSVLDTGFVQQLLINQSGCDSLILTNTYLIPSDTTLIYQSSCDPSQVGTSTQSYFNTSGCDSSVITTISFLLSDTTILFTPTCMYADTGTTTTLLINAEGCDSLVYSHTFYAGSDTSFIFLTTCSPADSGITFLQLINQAGCDSIIASYTGLLESDTIHVSKTSCIAQDTGVTQQLFVNNAGCDSLIVTTTTLLSQDVCHVEASISVHPPLCYSDPAFVQIVIQVGIEPFLLSWNHDGMSGSFAYPSKGMYSFPFHLEGETYITLTSGNGLVLSDTINVILPPPLLIEVLSGSDYHGYDLRCNGDNTGDIILNAISEGTPPLTYLWSDGSFTPNLSNVSAGFYTVTVTDRQGCTTTSSISLTEPSPLQYSIEIEPITCYGLQNGSLTLTDLQGGVTPWMTSLNGTPFESLFQYLEIAPGDHELVIMDQNGCSTEHLFSLQEPEYWSLDLGPDVSIAFGTLLEINATIHGHPSLPLELKWSDDQCENCQSRTIEAISNTTYNVVATDQNGCTSIDEFSLDVFIDRNLYIPNIFSPNGDQINDQFLISSGVGLMEIEELTLFDRWGNLVFQEYHVQPNDPTFAWNGRMNGKLLNPGVYTYSVVVIYKDERREVRYGDVTLVR